MGQGWRDLPFNIFPAKGRARGVISSGHAPRWAFRFRRPEPFPQPSLLLRGSRSHSTAPSAPTSRAASSPPNSGKAWRSASARVLGGLLTAVRRRSRGGVRSGRKASSIKALLKAECARAVEIGIIGAPSLVTEDGEVFWGNDRLEQGLDWAAGARPRQRSLKARRASPLPTGSPWMWLRTTG